MSPRTGRPKEKNPKNIDVKVRFDEETNRRLLAYSKAHGITRAETIREAVVSLLDEE